MYKYKIQQTNYEFADQITWQTIQFHLNLDDDTDKPYIYFLIEAEIERAEKLLGKQLSNRELTIEYSCIPEDKQIFLPYGPVTQVTSVTDDEDTALTYEIITIGELTFLNLDENTSIETPVTVVYDAGTATMPKDVQLAILQNVGLSYKDREGSEVKDRNAERVMKLNRSKYLG